MWLTTPQLSPLLRSRANAASIGVSFEWRIGLTGLSALSNCSGSRQPYNGHPGSR